MVKGKQTEIGKQALAFLAAKRTAEALRKKGVKVTIEPRRIGIPKREEKKEPIELRAAPRREPVREKKAGDIIREARAEAARTGEDPNVVQERIARAEVIRQRTKVLPVSRGFFELAEERLVSDTISEQKRKRKFGKPLPVQVTELRPPKGEERLRVSTFEEAISRPTPDVPLKPKMFGGFDIRAEPEEDLSFVDKLSKFSSQLEFKALRGDNKVLFRTAALGVGLVAGFTRPIRHPIRFTKDVFGTGLSLVTRPRKTLTAFKTQLLTEPGRTIGEVIGTGLFFKSVKGGGKIVKKISGLEIKTGKVGDVRFTGIKVKGLKDTRLQFVTKKSVTLIVGKKTPVTGKPTTTFPSVITKDITKFSLPSTQGLIPSSIISAKQLIKLRKGEILTEARAQTVSDITQGIAKLSPLTPKGIRKLVRKDILGTGLIIKPAGPFKPISELPLFEPPSLIRLREKDIIRRAKTRLAKDVLSQVVSIEDISPTMRKSILRNIRELRKGQRKEIVGQIRTREMFLRTIGKLPKRPRELFFDIERLPIPIFKFIRRKQVIPTTKKKLKKLKKKQFELEMPTRAGLIQMQILKPPKLISRVRMKQVTAQILKTRKVSTTKQQAVALRKISESISRQTTIPLLESKLGRRQRGRFRLGFVPAIVQKQRAGQRLISPQIIKSAQKSIQDVIKISDVIPKQIVISKSILDAATISESIFDVAKSSMKKQSSLSQSKLEKVSSSLAQQVRQRRLFRFPIGKIGRPFKAPKRRKITRPTRFTPSLGIAEAALGGRLFIAKEPKGLTGIEERLITPKLARKLRTKTLNLRGVFG